MVFSVELGKKFWVGGLLYASHLISRLSTARNKEKKLHLYYSLVILLLIMIGYIFLVVLFITRLGKANFILEPRKLYSWILA